MSITATFYTIEKKINSMKLPTGGTSKNIFLKDPTSLSEPSILLETSNPTAYNYCYIPSFSRYYWITDWISDHGMWIANCSVDVLTSFRSEILDSYQYVTRNQALYDLDVPDSVYPMIDGVEFDHIDFGANSPFKSNNIVSIIATVGRTNLTISGLNYYQLKGSDYTTFMNKLLDPAMTDYGSSFDVSKETMMALINPTQYIQQSYVLPYNVNSQSGSEFVRPGNGIAVGWWFINYTMSDDNTLQAYGDTGYKFYEIWSHTFNLPTRPNETQPLGNWASMLPYTEYILYAGPFGQITINTLNMNLGLGQSITARIKADLYGNAILTLEESDGNIIFRTMASVAIPFPISSLAVNRFDQIGGLFSSTLGAIGSAATGNVPGAIGSLMSGIDNAVKSQFPPLQKSGSSSANLCQVLEPWRLQCIFHNIAAEDREHFGRSLCQRTQLSEGNLTGYTECTNATIEIPGTKQEHDMIINFLNTGFYKEN